MGQYATYGKLLRDYGWEGVECVNKRASTTTQDVIEWCKQNCTGRFSPVSRTGPGVTHYLVNTTTGTLTYWFELKSDAVLFKLWSG